MVCLSSDPRFGGTKFGICKGGIEKNESAKQAALREAQEELGLRLKNVIPETITKIGRFKSANVSLEVFTGEVENPADFGPTDSEIAETRWMTPAEFMARGRAQHKPIIEHWVELIGKKQ